MPYIYLGDIQKAGGNEKAAIKTWKTGFEVARSYTCLNRIQKVYESTDKIHEITKLYQNAISKSIGKEKEDLILIFGMLLLEQGDLNEAIRTLSSTFENSSFVRNILLAKAFNQKKQKQEARKVEEVIFDSAKESVLELVGISKNSVNK